MSTASVPAEATAPAANAGSYPCRRISGIATLEKVAAVAITPTWRVRVRSVVEGAQNGVPFTQTTLYGPDGQTILEMGPNGEPAGVVTTAEPSSVAVEE